MPSYIAREIRPKPIIAGDAFSTQTSTPDGFHHMWQLWQKITGVEKLLRLLIVK